MSRPRAALSLKREIVLWYSLVLLVALGIFALVAYVVLDRALDRAGTASLRQTAEAAEQLTVPADIPRVATRDEIVTVRGPHGEEMEALRRRSRLATGHELEFVVVRSDDIEAHALRTFLLVSLLLIPLTAGAAALGGRALLQRLLEPLNRLVEATREIGIGGLSRRVAVPERPAELGELAHSFNGMLTRLERAVGALSRFTADASHELRTPLTSIRGTVQVALARERSAAELEDTLAEVMEETEWMLHLVDGLLTLARGEEGGGPRELRPVDLAPLLTDVCEMGEALASGKPVQVRLSTPESLLVPGSAGQLRQIFVNLVSNAAKFTQRGTVIIEAESVTDGGREWAEVRVSDTGPGIAPDELPRIFDRFYRGDAARSQPGGTGLGLAIARLLVELHGGTIEARSEPGVGSSFRVRLPRLAAASDHSPDPPAGGRRADPEQ